MTTGTDTRRFDVDGLCCAAEARQIEARLGRHPGVASLRIDPVAHTLDVAGPIEPAEVERAIAELGMTARPVVRRGPADRTTATRAGGTGAAGRTGSPRRTSTARVALAAASGLLFLATLIAGAVAGEAAALPFALAAVVTGGWYVFPRALASARHLALEMNFLMATAAVGAIAIGELAEAASVMFLFAVAQLLESRSMDRARNAIHALMELSPASALVLRDGREVRVPAEDVAVGELVVVRPGEKIAVDGTVEHGESAVNQAPITGESMPVEKRPGEEVFAGTLNGQGVLEVRSTRPAADTTLARIVHWVEDAQATRAPSDAFVDRFARVYTPVVVAAAVAMALVPPLLGAGPFGEWVYRGLALLVVACPCALVISTPVTVVSALAGAAREGILIKGGLHLENAGRTRVVALDKTGTLTSGEPEIVDVVALAPLTSDEVLALAAAAEARSEHPLARAILRGAEQRALVVPAAREVRAIAGRGIEALVDGRRVAVGSPALFAERTRLPASLIDTVRTMEERGATILLVGATRDPAPDADPAPAGERSRADGIAPIGLIAVADRVRSDAAAALRQLREAGVRRIVVLTGDNAAAARDVAASLGAGTVDEVRHGLLPQHKLDAVRELRTQHGRLLMVGDGINDAPALAAADVGVAMGAAGTDAALEAADIALMADELDRLPVLMRLARKAERIIRGNIAFALAIKAVFVVLAATGLATLWMAVLADMGASLLVVANGMRALRA